jgi:hypothetical protein
MIAARIASTYAAASAARSTHTGQASDLNAGLSGVPNRVAHLLAGRDLRTGGRLWAGQDRPALAKSNPWLHARDGKDVAPVSVLGSPSHSIAIVIAPGDDQQSARSLRPRRL